MFFDPNQHDPAQGAGQLPVGAKQPVVIESHALKGSQAKQNNGYVELVLRVIDGPNQGRSGADRLNLVNENQTAVEIAHKRFSAYCHVVGYLSPMATPDDIVNLYNKPFLVDVVQDPSDERYTRIEKVYDMSGNAPVFRRAPVAAPQAAPPAAPQAAPQAAPAEPTAAPAPAWGQQGQQPTAPPAPAAPQAAPATTWAQQQQTQVAPAAGASPVMGWGPR